MGPETRLHLLPQERWCAEKLLERQRTRRTPGIVRMELNLGRDGIILMAAAYTYVFPGIAIGLIGFVLQFASNDTEPLYGIAGYLIWIGVAIILPGIFRALQAIRAGRTFRGGRPYIRY